MSPILNMPSLMLELFPSQRMIYENYRSTRIEEPPHRQHKHVSFVYTPSVFRIPHSAFRISFAICYLLFAICHPSVSHAQRYPDYYSHREGGLGSNLDSRGCTDSDSKFS